MKAVDGNSDVLNERTLLANAHPKQPELIHLSESDIRVFTGT